MKRFKSGTPDRELVDVLKALSAEIAVEDGEIKLNYSMIEKSDEKRYTVGPMYAPMVKDAHDEYAEDGDLFQAMVDYNMQSDHTLRKQHGHEQIGHVLAMWQWPAEFETSLQQSDGTVRKVKLPANTVYSSALWTPEAWPLVKSGKIKGYSMGGAAVRLKDAAHDDELLKLV